jgi:hypothetical protein
MSVLRRFLRRLTCRTHHRSGYIGITVADKHWRHFRACRDCGTRIGPFFDTGEQS